MKEMTIPEAILRVLDEKKEPTTPADIYNIIVSKKYYVFPAETINPVNTVNAQAGNLVRHGDTRIKRIKKEVLGYFYYLTKYEQEINFDDFSRNDNPSTHSKTGSKFIERDLHKLLSTYLKSININSKTIFHEKTKKDDEHQKWTHPDMIGVQLTDLQSTSSRNLWKTINKKKIFKLFSYELKRSIVNDYELKQAYFQAVSNSSWANSGYLVSFEIDHNLDDEIERLYESFGIGVIELNSNPFQSKVWHPAKYKEELDIKTIDKLCKNNPDFNIFIERMEKLLNADEGYYEASESQLEKICDEYFTNDEDIMRYCREKNIPVEETDE
jgi:hypothetical protein